MIVEPFHEQDAEPVLRLAQRCLARPDEQLGTPLWATRDDMLRELAAWPVPPVDALFVAREGDEVAGFVGVECDPQTRMALLHGPIVDPALRGQGVGRELFELGLATARALGMREIWAAVGRENARATAIVRAAGFEPGEASAIYRLERKLHQPLEDDRLVTLTRATPEMLDEALAVIRECAPDQPISRDELWQMLHDPELSILLAGSEAGERIGVIAIDVRERWIVLLGVHESVRGRGFAGAMLSRALQEHWAEHPDVRLGMTVRIENVAAIGLYARQGFEPWVVVTRWSLTL